MVVETIGDTTLDLHDGNPPLRRAPEQAPSADKRQHNEVPKEVVPINKINGTRSSSVSPETWERELTAKRDAFISSRSKEAIPDDASNNPVPDSFDDTQDLSEDDELEITIDEIEKDKQDFFEGELPSDEKNKSKGSLDKSKDENNDEDKVEDTQPEVD